MDSYTPRKLKFKAWNQEAQLLMRLNSIDCVKGELLKKGHILLQFTGQHDRQQEELYDLDVVLIDSERYLVVWNDEMNGWFLRKISDAQVAEPLRKDIAQRSTRLWSYWETKKFS
jgi:hypothetical protein